MNAVDQIITEAHQQNPILGALLGVLMDGGRIVSTHTQISELFAMVPDILFFEERNIDESLADYSYKDLIFFHRETSVDQLWQVAHMTAAQVVVLSSRGSDETLCDYAIDEKDLRSALMNLRGTVEKLLPFKGQVSFDGSRLNKAIFLDRDGVLIEDVPYIQNPDEVKLNLDVVNFLKAARKKQYRLIVVTNQSGIGRGLYNFSTYEKVNDRILQLLADQSIFIDKVIKAPYFENSRFASGLVRKSLRKPRPGMIHTACQEFRIDLSVSIMIGDRARDLMSGAVAGIKNLVLLSSGNGAQEKELWQKWPLANRLPADTKFEVIRRFEDLQKSMD